MRILRAVFIAVLAAAPIMLLRAGDAEATVAYQQGREAYLAEDYRKAAALFDEAVLCADSPVVKSNALRARIAALQMMCLPYQEFLAIERLLTEYPEYADFVELVRREYELGRLYDEGVREPSFWSLRWIPWLVDGDKSIEIYTRALERAPYAAEAPLARLRLAFLLDREGQVKESIEQLRRVTEEFPDTPEAKWAWLALGNGLFELSRRGDGDARYSREAHDVFREFQNRYPDAPENDYVRTILAQSRDIQAERLLAIAEFYEKNGRSEAAQRYYAQVLREFPDSASAARSEARLAELDCAFVPDDFQDAPEPRFQRYRAFQLPPESGRLLIVPDRHNRKYLLPITDLGLGGEYAAADECVEEEICE